MSNKNLTPVETDEDIIRALESAEPLMDARIEDERNHPNPLVNELILACQDGNVDKVRSLLQAGADPNVVRTSGSALCCAMRSSHPIEIARLLVAASADPNLEENPGWTPLFCAAGINRADAIRFLVEVGADINRQCSVNGWTALMNSACLRHVSNIVELLALGADIAIKSVDGLTAIDIAKGNGHAKGIQVFSKYVELLSRR